MFEIKKIYKIIKESIIENFELKQKYKTRKKYVKLKVEFFSDLQKLSESQKTYKTVKDICSLSITFLEALDGVFFHFNMKLIPLHQFRLHFITMKVFLPLTSEKKHIGGLLIFSFLMSRFVLQSDTIQRDDVALGSFQLCHLRDDIKRLATKSETRSSRSLNPFSLPLPLVNSRTNEAREKEMKQIAVVKSFYFTSGNFPRTVNSSSRCVYEPFRFNGRINRGKMKLIYFNV